MKHLLTCLAAWLLLAAGSIRAQAPTWDGAWAANPATDYSYTYAVATDAQGNVFVTGAFAGTAVFGSTTLTATGANFDLFVAKWVPGSRTWAWAQRGGGTGHDGGYGIAVRGTSVYVTGYLTNNIANASQVVLGPAASPVPVSGAATTVSEDLLLAKYTDNGSSATLNWVQVAGGSDNDNGRAVAVSGSRLYVAGYLTNTSTDTRAVRFGSNGTTAGTSVQLGTSTVTPPAPDLLLACYQDDGAAGSYVWSQVGGGSGEDVGFGVAVSGSSVYVTGRISNTRNNQLGVVFGGSGTTPGTRPQLGASTAVGTDVLLAKYTDNGLTGAFNWSQVGGGTGYFDSGYGVAVSGSSVYVTGCVTNSYDDQTSVRFGGSGTTAGTVTVNGIASYSTYDLVLARYTDSGASSTVNWVRVGGGYNDDIGFGVAARGTSVYATGQITNDTNNTYLVTFATAGTPPMPIWQYGSSNVGSSDLVVAKYLDQGSSAAFQWSRVGGGTGEDYGYGLALSGQQVYVSGAAGAAATFGPSTVGLSPRTGVLATFLDPALPLATTPPATAPGPTLYPNPALGSATQLTGAAPGQAVQVLDALGRPVATAAADATGSAALTGLAPGLYLVRAGAATVRLAVE